MTNQEIINFIIEKLKDFGKLSFRGDDLYRLFLTGKDIEPQLPQFPRIDMLPEQFIKTDFAYFKKELLDYLTRNKIYYIMGDNDFLDIFISKDVFDDYKFIYMSQEEMNQLDKTILSPNIPREDRIKMLEKMHELSNKRTIMLTKYGE